MSLVVRLLGLLSVGAVMLSACKREAPPAGEDARAPTAAAAAPSPPTEIAPAKAEPAVSGAPAAAAPAAAADGAAGSSRYDEKNFAIVTRPAGAFTAGQEGAVEIVLDAKAPFHANPQYPYKFKAKEGPGVKYAQPVVGKDGAKLEAARVTMRVPFVPDGAGQRTIAGVFSFSVCTDETCLMEKRDLALVVDVK